MPTKTSKLLPELPTKRSGADVLSLLGGWAKNMADASNPDSNGGGPSHIAEAAAQIDQQAALRKRRNLQADLDRAFGLDGAQAPGGQAATPGPSGSAVAATPSLPTLRSTLPALLRARQGGLDIKDFVDLLDKAGPSIKIGPGGEGYDDRDPTNNGRRFSNPTVVNSKVVDVNADQNRDQYIAEPPVRGAVPVYGPEGKAAAPVGWKMPDGALQAISSTEAATSGGRAAGAAPFQMVTILMPDGSTEQMTLDAFRSHRGQSPGGDAGGANIGRGQTPADAEYAKRQAGAAQARFQKVQADGTAAPTKIANLQQIGALLDGVEGGKLAPLGLDIAQAANSLGFKIDSKLGNKEAANALSQQIALSFKDQLPGPLSNADRTFLVQMAPGLSQSAQGRKLMIDSATKVYQRQADVAKMARAWETKYGRLDAKNPATGKGFDDNLSIWVERNKLFPQGQK